VEEIRQKKKQRQQQEAKEPETKPKVQLKVGDRVRMNEGQAVGTLDKIEKGTAKVNYGMFTTTVALEKLELVQRKK